MPKKSSKRPTTRGFYPQTTINYAMRLKSRKIRSQLTLDEIAKRAGIRSTATLYRWKQMDMSKKARAERISKRACNRFLSKAEESLLCGWVSNQNLMCQSTSTRSLASFIDSNFGIKVSKQWISLFVHRKGLSYRTPRPMKKVMSEPSAYQQAYDFLSEIHSLGKSPSQIACLDKTGLYNDVRGVKQIGYKGR